MKPQILATFIFINPVFCADAKKGVSNNVDHTLHTLHTATV